MSVLQDLTRDFAFQVRTKGKQYYIDNLVEILAADPGVIRAKVQGTETYRVELRWEDPGQVSYSCTCPYFLDRDEPCKHIWATMLESDHQGSLEIAARRLSQTPLRGPRPAVPHINGVTTADQIKAPTRKSMWRSKLGRLSEVASNGLRIPTDHQPFDWPDNRRIIYAIDTDATRYGYGGIALRVLLQKMARSGRWSDGRRPNLTPEQWLAAPDPSDRRIMQYLLGSNDIGSPSLRELEVAPWAIATVLREVVETGRCFTTTGQSVGHRPLRWDQDPPWEFTLELAADDRSRGHRLLPRLRRVGQTDTRPLAEALCLSAHGWVVFDDAVARFRHHGAWSVLLEMREQEEILVPGGEELDLLGELMKLPAVPRLALPESIGVARLAVTPTPVVLVKHKADRSASPGLRANRLQVHVLFDYAGHRVAADDARAVLLDVPNKQIVERERDAEQLAIRTLLGLGISAESSVMSNGTPGGMTIDAMALPRLVMACIERGWVVEADGSIYRAARDIDVKVSSGIDWFDLSVNIDFGEGRKAKLPSLLEALRSGDRFIRLDDGTLGVLPEEWLGKYAMLAGVGAARQDGNVRFERQQTSLLDALLLQVPAARVDEVFEAARRELRNFQGVVPHDPPPTFTGTLRPYQREGLGWLHFLARFRFGGCLADDMGLGKTVQVLALLEQRRLGDAQARANGEGEAQSAAGGSQLAVGGSQSASGGSQKAGGVRQLAAGTSRVAADHPAPAPRSTNGQPSSAAPPPCTASLVVVPRSLVFNWKQEAARFCPRMRVLDHSGIHRAADASVFADYDLILTTYGTLRRDIGFLKDVRFDYVILDESQAIKNSSTASAKAVRLLRSDHRLAMSGTPIENHLGELWSLFEFLNPGMLGAGGMFKALATLGTQAASRSPDRGAVGGRPSARASAGTADPAGTAPGPSTADDRQQSADGGPDGRRLLAAALRPFILRRTKRQVANDLPDRVEQTIQCELPAQQRRLYDELRDHYRSSVLKQVDAAGVRGSQIQILEALLRLRQAACHPGLIDPKYATEPSAKLDVLVGQLSQLIEEDHKSLIFSQFTSFLALLRARLDGMAVTYEYLDGKTRDRQARVERFQNDPDCKTFLVSLKAGGVGLNLTAAEYVFLLDPWWNPAVEAQAIDRAHRIGQTRTVFAYRLIAADTVEQKVLQLQQTKRDLADAIINQDNSLLGKLDKEELAMLLS